MITEVDQVAVLKARIAALEDRVEQERAYSEILETRIDMEVEQRLAEEVELAKAKWIRERTASVHQSTPAIDISHQWTDDKLGSIKTQYHEKLVNHMTKIINDTYGHILAEPIPDDTNEPFYKGFRVGHGRI